MANLAKFSIGSSPADDRGYDVNPGDSLLLRLESPTLVSRVTFDVKSALAGAPPASRNAPLLTLSNGIATGQILDAVSPASNVTLSGFPISRAPHTWAVRCRVEGGIGPNGTPHPDYVFTRYVAMRSSAGARKILYCERDEYDAQDAWAGAVNDIVEVSGNGLPGTTSVLSETPITAGSGAVTLWSYAVPASTNVKALVEADFSTAGGKRWIGSLSCVAHRHGSGALTVDAQAMGSSLLLSDPDWNPEFRASGNTLELRVTADTGYAITPRGRVRHEAVSTEGDQQVSALEAARSAVLADAPLLLYYAEAGLTPSNPNVGADVTGWADQSGNGRNLTFIRNAIFGRDAQSRPYFDLQYARNTTTGQIPNGATGARVCRFTLDSAAAGQHGLLSVREAEVISIHAGTTAFSNGSNVMVAVNGTWRAIGAMQDGKHCYEIRLDPVAQTAQLFVDGVASPAVAMGAFNPPGTNDFFVLGSTTAHAPTGKLYGYAYQNGAGTDAQMNRWIAMSELAWGAND